MKRLTATTLVVSMLLSPVAYGGGAAAVTVNTIPCVAPNVHPEVVATVPDNTVAARVYFRAAGSTIEYWVDMVPARGGRWTAVLPKPSSTTRSFTYRVVARDSSGKEIASAPVNQEVQAFCAAGIRDANVRLGQPANAPATPEGWNVPSAPAAPATTTPPATTAPPATAPTTVPPAGTVPPPAAVPPAAAVPVAAGGAGLSAGTIALLAAAGLGAAWYAYDQSQDEEETSPSRP